MSEDFYSKLRPDYKHVEGCRNILVTPTWTVPYRRNDMSITDHYLCLEKIARDNNKGRPLKIENDLICRNTLCPKHKINGQDFLPPTGMVLVGN